MNLSSSPHRFIWKWSRDGIFSPASAYQAFFLTQSEVLGGSVLRKTQAPNECRFFVWLVLHGWCWTSNRLFRHGLKDKDICALCAQECEIIDHLIVSCPHSRETWFRVFCRPQPDQRSPDGRLPFVSWIQTQKQVAKPQRAGFDNLVVLVAWNLWKERATGCSDSKRGNQLPWRKTSWTKQFGGRRCASRDSELSFRFLGLRGSLGF